MVNLGKRRIGVSAGQLDGVEASSVGDERIQPRQNKGHRSLWNTRQGSSRRDSKGDSLLGGSGGGLPPSKRGSEEVWERVEFNFFDTCAWL